MTLPILAVAHVNLNCADLAANRSFFAALGLTATIRTDPAPQDCTAFGFEGDARWDAWMMQDSREGGTALDLLEWKEPRPIGSPPAAGLQPGLERLGLTAADIEAARKSVLAHGGWASEIQELSLGPGAVRTGFGATTPEGQPLLVLAADGDRLAHVGIGCTDLSRSEDFYVSLFGFQAMAEVAPGPLPASVFQPGPSANEEGSVQWRAKILYPAQPKAEPGQPHPFHVLLTEWENPKPQGRGTAEPHHLGLFRMAFLVDNIEEGHEELKRIGVDGLSPVVSLDLGPSCPAPNCSAVFFRDPDGTCLELIGAPAA